MFLPSKMMKNICWHPPTIGRDWNLNFLNIRGSMDLHKSLPSPGRMWTKSLGPIGILGDNYERKITLNGMFLWKSFLERRTSLPRQKTSITLLNPITGGTVSLEYLGIIR